jgi:hypothetical protein
LLRESISGREWKNPAGLRGATGRGVCDGADGSDSALSRDDAQSFGRNASVSPIRGEWWADIGLIEQNEGGADPSAGGVRFLPLALANPFALAVASLRWVNISFGRDHSQGANRRKPLKISGFLIPAKSEAWVTVSALAAFQPVDDAAGTGRFRVPTRFLRKYALSP